MITILLLKNPGGADEIKIPSKQYPEGWGMIGILSENYREDRK